MTSLTTACLLFFLEALVVGIGIYFYQPRIMAWLERHIAKENDKPMAENEWLNVGRMMVMAHTNIENQISEIDKKAEEGQTDVIVRAQREVYVNIGQALRENASTLAIEGRMTPKSQELLLFAKGKLIQHYQQLCSRS